MNLFKRPRAARYYTPERTKNEIVIYLSPGQPPPAAVPAELQPYVPKIIWDERIPMLAETTARYNKPLFERLHFLVALLACIIIPMGLHQVISNALHLKNGGDHTTGEFVEARAIGFGLFCAIALVFFLPLAAWKYAGKRRTNALLATWAADDRRAPGIAAVLPAWRCTTPTVFSSTVKLLVALPAARQPSRFHADAYFSAYINTNGDGADVPYVAPPRRTGDPHMSVIGRWSVQTPTAAAFSVSKA